MVKVREDLTGQIFGRLKVLEQTEDHITKGGRHEARWLCECACENHTIVEVIGNSLRHGHTKSCGCLIPIACSETMKKFNRYSEMLSDEYGNYYIGYTVNTNREFYVDAEDYDKIQEYTWSEHETAERFNILSAYDKTTRKKIKMHTLLGYEGHDHMDRNELNNRKYNLRKATHQENMRNRKKSVLNTSGFIGVTWQKGRQRWVAQIGHNGKTINLGGYIEIEDAVIARLKAEVKYFGEFAPQQHLYEQYGIDVDTKQND